MATATGNIKAELLARVGKGKPIVIGTIDIPVDVVLPSRVPRAHRRVRMGVPMRTGSTPRGGAQ